MTHTIKIGETAYSIEFDADMNIHQAIARVKLAAQQDPDYAGSLLSDIPERYWTQAGVARTKIADVTEIENDFVVSGTMEKLQVDLARCKYCRKCEDGFCGRCGTVDPESEPDDCSRFENDMAVELYAGKDLLGTFVAEGDVLDPVALYHAVERLLPKHDHIDESTLNIVEL